MRYILGLDISTSVVGYTVLDLEGTIHDMGYIKLNGKDDDLFDKAEIVHDILLQYKDLITDVAIEEPLVSFRPGFSMAQILAKLSTFNGMVSIMTKFVYNTRPVLYNVNHARKTAFPDLKFPKGSDRKELVRDAVAAIYPQIDWPTMTRGKNIGAHRKECYDMSDSAVIALCHLEKTK